MYVTVAAWQYPDGKTREIRRGLGIVVNGYVKDGLFTQWNDSKGRPVGAAVFNVSAARLLALDVQKGRATPIETPQADAPTKQWVVCFCPECGYTGKVWDLSDWGHFSDLDMALWVRFDCAGEIK